MTRFGYWLLTAACGILGIIDIIMFVRTPREDRTKLHWVLVVCGTVVFIMAIIQAVSLLMRGQPM